jgi:hypothetical protein
MIVRVIGWVLIVLAIPIAQAFRYFGMEILGLDNSISTVSYGTVALTGIAMIFWRD